MPSGSSCGRFCRSATVVAAGERFGPWKTVYERHRLCVGESADGTWEPRLLACGGQLRVPITLARAAGSRVTDAVPAAVTRRWTISSCWAASRAEPGCGTCSCVPRQHLRTHPSGYPGGIQDPADSSDVCRVGLRNGAKGNGAAQRATNAHQLPY